MEFEYVTDVDNLVSRCIVVGERIGLLSFPNGSTENADIILQFLVNQAANIPYGSWQPIIRCQEIAIASAYTQFGETSRELMTNLIGKDRCVRFERRYLKGGDAWNWRNISWHEWWQDQIPYWKIDKNHIEQARKRFDKRGLFLARIILFGQAPFVALSIMLLWHAMKNPDLVATANRFLD